MKLSELRPCDKCGGRIEPSFYVVEFSLALIGGRACREVFGMATILGGLHALRVAEALAPHPEHAVIVVGDEDPSLKVQLLICSTCFFDGAIDLAMLWEAVRQRCERAEATAGKDVDQ